MDFCIQGPAMTMKKVLEFHRLRYLQVDQVMDLFNSSVIWTSQ